MPVLITEAIPKQNFEACGEQIGAVLTLELDNQKVIQGLTDTIKVYHERGVPYDKAEGVMINVQLDNIKLDNHTEANVHAGTNYVIDVYGGGVSDSGSSGDQNASRKVQKYIGMILYILESTRYNTLGLPAGYIGGTYVDNVQMYEVEGNQDARNVKMGRIVFRVRLFEKQDLWAATLLAGGDTGVKLDLTDKGYKYELIN